ncbi:MAG: ribosome maturation factor RimM [Eubacteriales bacterium]|nr:ribosome maturation factor RimM [Eubacteriales bacterium]
MQDLLVTGKLLKARGLQGEIGLEPYADDLARYRKLRTCFLENSKGEPLRELEVVGVKLAGNRVYLRFAGIDSREAAAALSNHYLSVPRSEAQSLNEAQHYVADIVGCRVEDEQHGDLGQVTDIYLQNGQNLMKISQPGQADLFMPYVPALLLEVNPAQSFMRVRLPQGLYELYRG